MRNSYKKFAIILIISFRSMYAVMFLNVDKTTDIYLSLTRLYMSLLKIAPMAVIMIAMMGKMYPDKKMNTGIIATAILVFALALAGLRTQTPVGDVQYMKAMIPHHSSALLTSKNARLQDPEVRKLADGIIESQEREIKQMKEILHRMNK